MSARERAENLVFGMVEAIALSHMEYADLRLEVIAEEFDRLGLVTDAEFIRKHKELWKVPCNGDGMPLGK